MKYSVFKPADAGWVSALAACEHDFYHVPGYVELEARRIGGDAVCVVVTEDDSIAVFPLVTRGLPLDLQGVAPNYLDATSPYGYPSPVFGGARRQDVTFVSRSFETLLDVMREHRLISVFLRLHPLLPIPEISDRTAGIEMFEHGETVWIDLTQSADDLFRQTRPTHRNLIARAKREGFVVAMDDSTEGLEAFGAVYRATMQRLDASPMYMFTDDYFRRMKDALGGDFKLWKVSLRGELAAAGLFPVCNGIVQYHLSGTHDAFTRQSPTRILIAEVRDWAAVEGYSAFHLGGGLGSQEDGLFRFKAGFSKHRAVFRTMRIVGDQALYQLLVKSRMAGKPMSNRSGFFPLYRASI